MSVIIDGTSTELLGVGVEAAKAGHAQAKPIPHNDLGRIIGHYRAAGRFSTIASQGANTRLWECRNGTSNLIVPTRLRFTWMQTGNFTAAIRLGFDLYKSVSDTQDDTGATFTPSRSPKKTGMRVPQVSPGPNAVNEFVILQVQVAGASGGMTGGAPAPDSKGSTPLWTGEVWALLTLPTTDLNRREWEVLDDVNGTYPVVLQTAEGFSLWNAIAHGVTASATMTWDFSWAEVAAF